MNKRIIYPTHDGGVAIIIPAPEARQTAIVSAAVYETVTLPATKTTDAHEEQKLVVPEVTRLQTDDEFINWIAAKDVPTGVQFKIIDSVDVPTDRMFRAAWEFSA
ncbi:hypothetical protein UFOVP1309_47 [uncultured Caudovirales phage]|uniref:Phage protein n=1 Tax=uncultured Caudovirales phage TaxID=2100421 RepID=A0A6J5RLZ7_9CAUD|nr:hypothetical protein UFOVP1309_47 [uncultured Caudovirales phage]